MTTAMPSWKFNSGNHVCLHGASCVKYGCTYAHPSSRPKDCPDGAGCCNNKCKLHHPRSNKDVACRFGLGCTRSSCPFDHSGVTTSRFRRPCMHGAFCVKFGCIYAHPAGRKKDCKFGIMCKDSGCPNLHPRPKLTLTPSSPTSNFQLGQQVQAQYRPGAPWKLASVCLVRPSSLSLQFNGYNDVCDVPLERVRHVAGPPGFERTTHSSSKFGPFISRGAAVASPKPPSPKSVMNKSRSQSDAVKQLELLKRTAVAQEDFLLADEVKQKINAVVKLEAKKTAAVHAEEYLVAKDIHEQIAELVQRSTQVHTHRKVEVHEGMQNQIDKLVEPYFPRTCREVAVPLFSCNQFTSLFAN